MTLAPHETGYRPAREEDRPASVELPCPRCHMALEDHDAGQRDECAARGVRFP